MGRVPRGKEVARVVHHSHAHGNVADGYAIVDQGLIFPLVVPGLDVRDSDFHFERGGDAVHGFVAVVLRVLPVRVQIDEAWRNHQAGGVDGGAAFQRRSGNGLDLAAGNAQIANGVEAAFRIDDAAVANYQVVLLRAERRQEKKETDGGA